MHQIATAPDQRPRQRPDTYRTQTRRIRVHRRPITRIAIRLGEPDTGLRRMGVRTGEPPRRRVIIPGPQVIQAGNPVEILAVEPQRIARIPRPGDRGRPTERIQTRRPGQPGAVRDVGDTARRVGQQPRQGPAGSAVRDCRAQRGLRVGPPGMRGRPVAGGLTDPDG